jgi:hypothetical protein
MTAFFFCGGKWDVGDVVENKRLAKTVARKITRISRSGVCKIDASPVQVLPISPEREAKLLSCQDFSLQGGQ